VRWVRALQVVQVRLIMRGGICTTVRAQGRNVRLRGWCALMCDCFLREESAASRFSSGCCAVRWGAAGFLFVRFDAVDLLACVMIYFRFRFLLIRFLVHRFHVAQQFRFSALRYADYCCIIQDYLSTPALLIGFYFIEIYNVRFVNP
jgi:hypothetical protein